MTFASVLLGFSTKVQVSKPQLELPSGRYQVFEGDETPMEQWPSWLLASLPVQTMVRSTAMLFPSRHSTFVEKSQGKEITSAAFRIVWLMAGSLMSFRKTTPLPDGVFAAGFM